MHLKQITDVGKKREHIAANHASVIRQALCRSHERFTCTLEDTSRNVPKVLISGGSNNRKLFICSLNSRPICDWHCSHPICWYLGHWWCTNSLEYINGARVWHMTNSYTIQYLNIWCGLCQSHIGREFKNLPKSTKGERREADRIAKQNLVYEMVPSFCPSVRPSASTIWFSSCV